MNLTSKIKRFILSNRGEFIIVFFIFLLGFGLRFYAATTIPLNWDESEFFNAARKISFNPTALNLPLVDKDYPSPIAYKYLIKSGIVFEDSALAGRLPFVLLGSFTILLVYFLTKLALGKGVGFLAAFLLAISQFHIGSTRIADDVAPLLFLSVLSLFIFYKSLHNSDSKLLLLNGLVIGVGFWFKENMFFLIPIYIIFLAIHPDFRKELKNKYVWFSFALAVSLALPLIFLDFIQKVPRFGYISYETGWGLSINALGLYAGEVFLFISHRFKPALFDFVAGTLDIEYPMVNWLMGTIILISVAMSLKKKNFFIRLLVVIFLFNFILFSFLRNTGDMDVKFNSPWSMASLDWGVLAFIPGLILAANMIYSFFIRQKRNIVLITFLIIFLLSNTIRFINFPLNCFVPIKGYAVREWYRLVNKYYLTQYPDKALRILERISKITDDDSPYKKKVAAAIDQIKSNK